MTSPETPNQDAERQLACLAEVEATTSSLHHDLRGILSPALLVADRLVQHGGPKVKAGKTVIKAVKRTMERPAETKGGSPKTC